MRPYSIQYRAEIIAISVSTFVYAIIISGSSFLIQNDRHQRHERHAMAVMESIKSSDARNDEDLADFVSDFSNKRLLVWISRGPEGNVVMPSGKSSINLQSKELLDLIDYKSKEMAMANSFSWDGNRYFSCSMPAPGRNFSVRFLEDVGVDPLATQSTWIGLFLFWLGISSLSIVAIKLASFVLLKPVKDSSELISRISLDDLEDSRMMAQIAQDNSPLELRGFLNEYSSLLSRIQSDYENTKFIISGVGHEMREGFSSVMNYVSTLERPAISSQEKGDTIRSCKAAISSSVNTLDNILRLAKNGSGLSAIVVKDVPLKSFVDLLRFRFEKPNHSFPVSVQSRLEEGVIEEVSIALDVSVLEWSVESLLLNAKKYAFTPQGAVVSVAIVNSADLEVSVSDFGSGVDPEDRMRIFKRYSRGMNTNDAPGTGIGLAVVSELLKLIGARVEVVDPAAGVGACFRITVPGVVSKV